MIKITKNECFALKKMGFDNEYYLHKTVGTGKKATYYATETKKLLDKLYALRTGLVYKQN